MKKLLFATLMLICSLAVQAQRLPAGVTPEHYRLTFTPNLTDNTFDGDEYIDVRIDKPTTMITLNAIEIQFKSVTVQSGRVSQTAKVTLEDDREQAHLIAPATIPAGPATLHIVFKGTLNDKLRGFYLSQTPKRKYAVTQFESTDARRAFPCFDEPDKKATFDITLIVDKGDTAISNEKLASDTPGPGEDKHTLKFATTKKLSTYLIAMLVGDFQCTDAADADGIPIRGCATPEKVGQAKFAVEAAQYIMHYYDTYFGIKYPFGKLDLIAVPDFEAGAMENAGAITYRESLMLLDPKVATVDNYRNVSLVVAHEMAHQWFGDLVTMKWWDNIWLNEGFATWMETKPVAQWKPEWNIPLDEVAETNGTLNLDSLKNTRPIRQKAETPAEINELFDGIAYGKAASVLRMVENYVDPALFQKGVQNYLRAHSYGNATAEDFWSAITRSSGKPADKIMSSFIVQPGEPLLHVAEENGKMTVTQERFFSDRQLLGTAQQQVWAVPVCYRAVAADSGGSCFLLDSRLKADAASSNVPIFANAGARGYYRTEYDQPTTDKLTKEIETGLTPAERISFLGDEWVSMRVGRLSISKYLDTISQLKGERHRQVWGEVLDSIAYISDKLVNDRDRPRFEQFVRNLLGPVYSELSQNDQKDPEAKELRADLFRVLGLIGKDPRVLAEARQITDKYLQAPDSVDPLLAREALPIAASQGDEALFQQIVQKLKSTNDQILRGRYMDALAHFQRPELVQQALQLGISGEIRNQDSTGYLSSLLRNPATRDVAWKFMQTHWKDVAGTFTTSSGSYLVSSTGQFCNADAARQVKDFFATHTVPASDRALRQAVERIQSCADLKSLQATNLQSWLFDHINLDQQAASAK